MNKINWKQKLSSRKFWAAVAGFVTAILVAFNVENGTVEQITAIITQGTIARAGLRNADPAAVKPGKTRNMVQVQDMFCHAQTFQLALAMMVNLRLSLQKSGITGKALLAFSDNSRNRRSDQGS